jgi:hypothetical protein
MIEGTTKLLTADYTEAAKRHLCPQCHSTMNEVERINENGFSFVWYECTRAGCDGQWLEKRTISAA